MGQLVPLPQPVPCPSCEAARNTLEDLHNELTEKTRQLEEAEADLRKQRRAYSTLKAKIHREKREGETYEIAETIFAFWQKHCRPKARTFDDERLGKVLTRLKDRPGDVSLQEQARFICEAILGAKYAANVGRDGKRYDELTLICRDAAHLEDFHDRYERHRETHR